MGLASIDIKFEPYTNVPKGRGDAICTHRVKWNDWKTLERWGRVRMRLTFPVVC